MPKIKLVNSDVVYLSKKSEELEAYIEWKATPSGERVPPSQRQLAPVLGVTERTLSQWNRDPRVIAKISKRVLSQPLVDALPDIISSLIEIASDPSHPRAVAASKSYFELLSAQSAEVEVTDLGNMSQAELMEHVAELYDEVAERGSKTKQA